MPSLAGCPHLAIHGTGATTLEWTLPSPAPFPIYETLPRIT